MSDPYLGEIKVFSFNFPPQGWASCSGQQMPIGQNQALFSLLGIAFGGDGKNYFNLPDFRGRVPIHYGNGYLRGQKGGLEQVAIDLYTLPTHSHDANGSSLDGNNWKPGPDTSLATSTTTDDPIYGLPQNMVAMNTGILSEVGGGQSHNNMQPSLVLNFCIATAGTYPPRP